MVVTCDHPVSAISIGQTQVYPTSAQHAPRPWSLVLTLGRIVISFCVLEMNQIIPQELDHFSLS